MNNIIVDYIVLCWQVQSALPSDSGVKTAKVRDDDRRDIVSSHSHTSVQSADSYAETFESDSHVAAAEVRATNNGMVDLA